MKKRTTDKEIQALCLALVQDFLKKWHYSNTRLIDIETFLTEYLGAKIVYETFAEKVPGRGGFIADGNRPLPVLRNGVKQDVVFPIGVIVINSCLKHPNELARLRFTLAHEAAHLIMMTHFQGDYTAAFHTEFVEGESYTTQMLKDMLTVNEAITNKAAACLLMPDFIVDKALNWYNSGDKITVYADGDVVIPDPSKKKIQRMADFMGVSFSACYYRLKEIDRLDVRPLSEYVQYFCDSEAGHV